MTYTGYQSVTYTPAPRTTETVLEYAEHVALVAGKPLKHKALGTAAQCAEKMQDLRTARTAFLAQADEQLATAGLAYASGEATAQEVLLQAVTLATATSSAHEVQRLTEIATRGIDRHGLSALGALTETWWLAGLKQRASDLLAAAHQVADQLGHTPHQQTLGIRHGGHPWAPSTHTLETDLDARHRWEKLEAILSDLDDVHATADGLRTMGYIPTVPGREHSEDYRWRRADLLNGDPAEVREFFLANRGHAEPGLYTSDELADTKPPHVRELGVDRYTAHVLAGDDFLADVG